MSTASIAERVAAGVAWLDENEPGWANDINLDRLDLGSCRRCVLGQLYGEYYAAPFEVRYKVAPSLGFDCHPALADTESSAKQYAELTAEWVRVIGERRTQMAVSR